MVHTSSKFYTKSSTHLLKNLLIVIGICISLIAISFLNSRNSSSDLILTKASTELKNTEENLAVSTYTSGVAENSSKVKTHHNFIVSYLLQDTSVERNTRNSPAQADLSSSLKQIHKIIISQPLGLF